MTASLQPAGRRDDGPASGRLPMGLLMASVVLALLLAVVGRFGPPVGLVSLLSFVLPGAAGLAGLGALAGWRFARSRGWRLAFGLFGMAGLSFLLDVARESFRPPLPAPDSQGPVVRVVAFNVWSFNRAPEQASAWILARDPDVVVLLEASGAGARVAAGLAHKLPFRATCRGSKQCSTQILSRTAPLFVRPLADDDADNRRALSALWARFRVRGQRVDVAAVHLSRPLPLGRQLGETEALIAALGPVDRGRLVLAGDFNAPLWTLPMRRLTHALALAPLTPDTPSWPTSARRRGLVPLLPLDHALIGPAWRAAKLSRGPAIGSDHLPMLIELVPDHGA